ncbi:uncharacterized protein RSE6_04247 [Rhynchosporium secalis]|uniref:Uncharacterized protein n=1 Tax=Rhynchosporium secalis TaxID=38038 RepID=A0A1E1M4U0_RHYSE|nr:uncharacterized protein RSE6_04247 [Rhynchosporium secalis]
MSLKKFRTERPFEIHGDGFEASIDLVSFPTAHDHYDANKSSRQRNQNIVRTPRITKLMARVLGYNAAFSKACEAGDLDKAKSLFRKGVDLNPIRHEKTALGFAALGCHIALAIWLLESWADIDLADGRIRSPIYQSIRGRIESYLLMTELLLRKGAEVNAGFRFDFPTALWEAARSGKIGAVVLLGYGAEVKANQEYPH